MFQEFTRFQSVAPRKLFSLKSYFEWPKIPDCGPSVSGTDPQGPPLGGAHAGQGQRSEALSHSALGSLLLSVSLLAPGAGAASTCPQEVASRPPAVAA